MASATGILRRRRRRRTTCAPPWHGRTVGIGGSITVEELGVYPRLAEDNQVFWHWKQDPAQARAQAGAAEVYLCSANGVSETGEIVNIDGTGNRLAASMYGKKKVYIIIGVNKVEPTLEQAIPAGAGRGGAAELAAASACRRPARWRRSHGVLTVPTPSVSARGFWCFGGR